MFGYKDDENEKRFIFSPLGNLFLKHFENEEKRTKIFTSMLWAIQFPHPHSSTPWSFNLFPFRLIFTLLSDERLGCKLYSPEIAYWVMQQKTIDEKSYNELVRQILDFRKLTTKEKEILFSTDKHLYVNASYEWNYISTLLEQLNIINRFDMKSNDVICRLTHPNRETSKSGPTIRTVRNNYCEIAEGNKNFITKLIEKYSCFEQPLQLDDPHRMKLEVVKEIYNFYPSILMEQIGESDELSSLLELPKLIETYSNNPDNDTAYLFEEVLVEGFDMFYNAETKRIGGAGHTDIECLYLTKKKKFAVESKSTANKLSGINIGRLREHREEIGGEYTIVITPRYVPAAKRDIKGSSNVIILASTFAEYLYNHIFHEVREVDYADFDNIIINHLGEDVSKYISNMTMEKFAVSG
ncbi:hypothetical protein SDC9_75499 [bioreactor metagenome]|uniref:Restriction endonuclease n=1 Tax=bioreactor metagenome TaxID=1076179 RepID=A0A644YM60_9ZZZZ